MAAGALGGVVGSAGGITSLITYPALLLVGVPALAANATNIVALAAFLPGVALGSQPELKGWGTWLERWTPVTLVGGALGAGFLLLTPPDAFERVVPFLVVTGSLALVCAPWLSRRRASPTHRPWELGAWLLLMAAYGGYFGAGAGVMTLALMLIMVDQHLPTANALKNVLMGATSILAGLLLAFLAPIDWSAALALAAGILVGTRIGPAVARRVPATRLRWAVFAFGIGMAIYLWADPSF